jgi:RNA polymerase sigma factor (sigma-70 family)
MQPVPHVETKEQFIEQYRRLCGHIARSFVAKWRRKLINAGGGSVEETYFLRSGFPATRTLQCKAEDLAGAALIKLMKCPERYWNQPYYVKRLIVNAIIDEQKVQQKIFQNEWQSPEFSNYSHPVREYHDWFDTQPGRDGLAEATRVKFDGEKITRAMTSLSQAERLVVELYFGLYTDNPIREYKIAAKLGRDQGWVERRLKSGLNNIRRQLGQPVSV